MATSKRKRTTSTAGEKSSAPENVPSPGDEISFEDSLKRLSNIVDELESGELSLEQSLERFEEGVRLARTSQARLDQAEAKVEELLSVDEEGRALTEEIEES